MDSSHSEREGEAGKPAPRVVAVLAEGTTQAPVIDSWIQEIKARSAPDQLGMILVHNGIVRATSKEGKPVNGMVLSYDEGLLAEKVARFRKTKGIVDIKVWINRGKLAIGDDIMRVVVAGRYRTDVLPVFEQLIREIKNEVVEESET